MQFSLFVIKKFIFRITLVGSLLVGFLMTQTAARINVYAQTKNTETPTEIRPRLTSVGGYCGPDLAKLNLSLQYKAISATRSVKGALCGRLIIINDVKSTKDYLGLIPCGGGSPLIFDMRPRELVNYYQLVNAKVKKGKTIRTKAYGDLNNYIQRFDTYYPMADCNGCGYLPGYAPPPTQSLFIFPGNITNPTSAPILGQVQNSPGRTNGFGQNGSSVFVFPTSTSALHLEDLPIAPSFTPSPTASQTAIRPTVSTSMVYPTASPTVTFTPKPEKTPHAAAVGGLGDNPKPPPNQPPFGVFGYSLYTFLLVPPIFFWILWRRARLV